MLQPELSLQVRLLAEKRPLPGPASAERVAEVAPIQPGQRIQARVMARLPDGRFKVDVHGSELALSLPAGTRAGQEMWLTPVGTDRAANYLLLQAHSATAAPAAQLSSAARLVARLSQARVPLQPVAAAATAAPLLDAPDADVGVIESRLRQAMGSSGLFYESHQARWVAGERPLELLLLEPQARLQPARTARSDTSVPAPDTTPATGRGAPEQSTLFPQTRPAATDSPAHPDALPIIQQQLAALETGQVLWQGQLWPGQPMLWSITGRESREGSKDPLAIPEWETGISLELPVLGAVEATLHFRHNRVVVRLEAGDENGAGLMHGRIDELAVALQGAGIKVASISVDARHV